MKKLGLLVFIAAIIVGVAVTNILSTGSEASTGKGFFNFNFDWKGVKGSGNVITESRDVRGFHGIDVGGIYQVEVTAGREFSVTVEADDNLMPLIRTEVSGGILRIDSSRRISPKSNILIKVSAPNIDDLDISGVANVTVSGLKNSELSIDSSGASKVAVSGETSKLTVDVSGATRIDAEGLVADKANVEASGASNVGVHVLNEIRANASGASHITYLGSPSQVQKNTSGAGNVSPR
jgi:hypothetical protein